MEKAMATHASTLAWKIPWTEEPGRLQSMGSLGVRHDWATSLSLFSFMHWRRKWQPNPVFLPGESQGRESLVGCHLWVAQSRTQLKWLSSSSNPPPWGCFKGLLAWYLEFTQFQLINAFLPILGQLGKCILPNFSMYHSFIYQTLLKFSQVSIKL